MRKFRVVDYKSGVASNVFEIAAHNPEAAALAALGQELVRSGLPRDLKAKVFTQRDGEMPSMVRLYSRRAPFLAEQV